MKQDGISVTRVLRVTPYADWPDVAFRLLGGVTAIGGTLIRFFPARDPLVTTAYCQSIDVDGLGAFDVVAPSGYSVLAVANTYSGGAQLTCTYTTPPWDQQGSNDGSNAQGGGEQNTAQQEIDLCGETWDFSAQNIVIPNDRMKFNGEAVTLQKYDLGVTKTIANVAYKISRHLVINLPSVAISKLLGKINAAAFTILNRSYAINTLRLDGASVSRKTTNQGIKFFEVTYAFGYNPNYGGVDGGADDYAGWNRIWHPVDLTWRKPEFVADANQKIYDLDTDVSQTIGGASVTGFNLLFHPGAV